MLPGMRITTRLLPLVVACGIVAAGASAETIQTSDAPHELGPLPERPTKEKGAWTAHIAAPTIAHARPGAGARTRLSAFTPWTLTPSVYLVMEARDVNGVRWLRIQLPQRPNGRTGWVREEQVVLKKTRTWITVSNARRTVTVHVGGKARRTFRASVGTGGTPTPRGLFAIYDPVPTGGPLGPHILVITAHSNVLKTFAGGDGVVGIHGWPSSVGQAASHGCVRLSRSGIAALRTFAQPGTPVEII